MANEHKRELWKRNALARRERVIADGGVQLTVLLQKDAAEALEALTSPNRSGIRRSKLEVVSTLLLSAVRVRRPAKRASARSK